MRLGTIFLIVLTMPLLLNCGGGGGGGGGGNSSNSNSNSSSSSSSSQASSSPPAVTVQTYSVELTKVDISSENEIITISGLPIQGATATVNQ